MVGDAEPLEELSSISANTLRKEDFDAAIGAVGGPVDRDTKAFSIVCVGILGTSVDRLLCPKKLFGNLNDLEAGFCVVWEDLETVVAVGLGI